MIVTSSQIANEYRLGSIPATRTELIQAIFGQATLPSDTVPLVGDNYDHAIDLPNVDYTQRMVFTGQTGTANGKLVIIAHGHDAGTDSIRDADFTEYTDGTGDRGNLLALGYDVVEVFMMGIRPQIALDGDVNILFGGGAGPNFHNDIRYALNNDSWRFMVEHVIALINTLYNSYDNIIMMGKSGGAWMTMLCAALDPRITFSVPIAGTVPRYVLRDYGVAENDAVWDGDFEQHGSYIREIASVMDLYAMACDSAGRTQKQYLNSNDTIASLNFAADHASEWETYLQARVAGTFTATSVAGAVAHEVPGEIWATLSPAIAAL